MRPLTASEAADLARVITHPAFCQIERTDDGSRWWVEFTYRGTDGEMMQALARRTLRACLRAAVRWMEEQEGHHA